MDFDTDREKYAAYHALQRTWPSRRGCIKRLVGRATELCRSAADAKLSMEAVMTEQLSGAVLKL